MKIVKFAALACAFSFGAHAQEIRLYGDKPLVYRESDIRVTPYIVPFSEHVNPWEKGNLSSDPNGSWRNRLLLGAQGTSGSGAGASSFRFGVVLNGKQQFQLGINQNLDQFSR